jgi:LPXTG-site transpeptidase (sortase) family protein
VIVVALVLSLLAPRGYLLIPAIDLYRPVGTCPLVDGWHDTTALGNGVCHLEGTTWIDDDWGRVALGGHTPGAFARLTEIGVGDVIILWDRGTVEVYRVTWRGSVPVSDISWLMPTTPEHATLITCSDTDRLIIDSERVH